MALGKNKIAWVILDTQTGDGTPGGDGVAVLASSGDKYVIATGTFDGATVTIERKDSRGGWIAIDGGTFTEASTKLLESVPTGSSLRASVSSSGGSTDIDAEITL